jgi:autotransporter-associated beta strand protein
MRHTSLKFASFLAAAAITGSWQSARAQTLFSDNFETGTFAANYDIFSSNAASDFSAGYQNYTSLSYQVDDGLGGFNLLPVPQAPNSTGSSGLVMRINDVSNQVNSISAYPKLQDFSGNYRLTFDMFMAYNGPALGGTASTEFMLAGINQGAVGNRVAGPLIQTTPTLVTGENTGNTVAVSGEGGSATDYRTYIDQTNQAARGFAATGTAPQNHTNDYYDGPTGIFPSPPFETAGAPGKQWVKVELSQIGGVITWKINNNLIASYADTTRTSGNITLGYMDVNATSESPAVAPYQFIVYDNVKVEGVDTSIYWDVNGTTAGAGGPSPSGAWDGTTTNFNTDSTGAAGGALSALTTAADTVVFSAGTDGTGAYNVAVTGTQNAAAVRVDRGAVTFTGGTIASPAYNVATGASASVGSAVGSTTGLTKSGDGSLTLTSANTYTGGTTVAAGTLVAGHANAIGTGQALTVNAGGTLRSQAGVTTALDVNALTVAPTGRVDLNDGGLVKRNGSGAAGQTATQAITALLKTGLENGGNFDWAGPGISSTEAKNDNTTAGSVLYGVGVLQNNLAVAGSPNGTTTDQTAGNEIYTSFKGRTVALNDTLVRYTYMGDADLSGDVTSTDYSLIDSGFALDLTGWVNGDFDYSGEVDATDYALIDNAFAFQTGVLPADVQAMYRDPAVRRGLLAAGARRPARRNRPRRRAAARARAVLLRRDLHLPRLWRRGAERPAPAAGRRRGAQRPAADRLVGVLPLPGNGARLAAAGALRPRRAGRLTASGSPGP